jgi:hypothetical protein
MSFMVGYDTQSYIAEECILAQVLQPINVQNKRNVLQS